MLTHQVFYRVNPKNPEAAAEIVRQSRLLLANIPEVLAFNVGKPVRAHRAVMGGIKYDVAMTFNFESPETERQYQNNPRHLEYVKFVLKGWMLEGSKADNPEQEFIDHILGAKECEARKWIRNPCIPENEVVWNGEDVVQFM